VRHGNRQEDELEAEHELELEQKLNKSWSKLEQAGPSAGCGPGGLGAKAGRGHSKGWKETGVRRWETERSLRKEGRSKS